MSDWAGVHSTDGAVRHGMDLEMGTDGPYNRFFLADPFLNGIKDGTYPMSLLDDKARRNLRVILSTQHEDRGGSLNTAAHQANALKIAEAGMVLLGDNAVRLTARGGGSAGIKAFYEVTPLQGIINRAGALTNVTFSQGYRQPERRQGRPDAAGVRSTQAVAVSPEELAKQKELVDRAVRAARTADVVIYVGGLYHGRGGDEEGDDRPNMKMPFGQDELLKKVVAANKRTVVVLISGAPLEMPWLPKVPAVLEAWYPGMEGGNAIASVLFGDTNPSGKLPFTMPKQLMDSPAHALDAYPGKDGVEVYKEGLLVGYRWFDTNKIEPLFPFGFGLSYTTFGLSNARIEGDSVMVDVQNTGPRDGAEVVQLYVKPNSPRLPRPIKELKGFAKVWLKSGEIRTVQIPFDARSFAFYDPDQKGWTAEAGDYELLVGTSSRDIASTMKYKLTTTSKFTEASPAK
jgi:beta-glucosidase